MSELFYASKYALSDGKITTTTGTVSQWSDGREVLCPPGAWSSFVIGRDAHRTFAGAKAAAEAARIKKIASLEKQIKKLRAMQFEEPSHD